MVNNSPVKVSPGFKEEGKLFQKSLSSDVNPTPFQVMLSPLK
jgi:hypothetical protein